MTYLSSTPTDVFYPDSDEQPMSDNTRQYQWIVTIKENLEILLENDLDAFIAGDLLWYPIEGDNVTRLAPDVMVVFGRPKGHRASYQQWKERNIPPYVVFEILSPSNTQREMQTKRSLYETHGVHEFYIYDPDRHRLSGYIRQGDQLLSIANMEGWISPSLKIRFSKINGDLEIYYPNGRRFLTTLELNRQVSIVEEERDLVTQERDLVTQERDRLLEQLRALGIDPNAY